MNVVVVMMDSFRPDHVGAYGPTRCLTPCLDAFANRATVFEKSYQATFPTVPTRADMFCGRPVYPELGWEPLPRTWPVLAKALADAGYLTQMVIDTPHPIAHGFHYERGFASYHWERGQESDILYADPSPDDVPLPAPADVLRNPGHLRKAHYRNRQRWSLERDRFAPRTMTYAMDWLERNRERGPFFLYVDTFDPHEPWDAPPWYLEMYRAEPFAGRAPDYPLYRRAANFLTEDETRHLDVMYSAEATMVDLWVGRLLRQIDRLGLESETIVIVMSDHGFYLGDHGFVGKLNMFGDEGGPWPKYDSLARTVLMVHLPGQTSGARSTALVQPTDLAPSVCDLLGVTPPESFAAPSYAPILRGEADDVGRTVTVTTDALKPGSKVPQYLAVTDGAWTLNVCPHQATVLNHVAEDPQQTRNVVADHRDHAQRLFEALLQAVAQAGVDPAVVQTIHDGVRL